MAYQARRRGLPRVVAAVGGAALMALASATSATLVATISGNDCAGVFGQGFEDCSVNGSPVIIKFDGYGEGSFSNIEINSSLFPTIDGSEFSFDIPFPDGSLGDWTYVPGDGDPAITFFVAKGGPNFNLFSVDGGGLSGTWNTPTNSNNGNFYGLSHLTFYDTEGPTPPTGLPEPGTLLLLGGALAALSLRRRFCT